ncbi:uncharacterized protein LOC131941352 [Physella acuta]|uniref:uncharacterized protein LOC131941352 n=1 Tax=Physella acuta TaxID=109671 RepID=UPI0027DC7E3B|nr:uncharacterized protein LOC131941352 [Physella acuta]
MTLTNSLLQAILDGNIKKVKKFLARGSSLNSRNDFGFGSLVAALHIQDGAMRSRMFRFLLNRGASYMARDERHDRSVVHWAGLLGRSEQIQTLMEEAGGDLSLESRDKDGYTALHHAVRAGDLPTVDTLVKYHQRYGISVDAPDHLGLTPYMHARRLGFKVITNLLYSKGQASVGHGDLFFRSPREWSQIGKFERHKATELQAEGQINAAKMLGKLSLAKDMEARALSLAKDMEARAHGHTTARLSLSHPGVSESLAEAPESSDEVRVSKHDEHSKVWTGRHMHESKQKLDVHNFSSLKKLQYNRLTRSLETHHIYRPDGEFLKSGQKQAGDYTATQPMNTHRGGVALSQNTHQGGAALSHQGGAALSHTHQGGAALSLLSQSTQGRTVSRFCHSEPVNKPRHRESRRHLDNLTAIMGLLSDSSTKSFRKSAQFQKPEHTTKIPKTKPKISSWAVIFGDSKNVKPKKLKTTSTSVSNDSQYSKAQRLVMATKSNTTKQNITDKDRILHNDSTYHGKYENRGPAVPRIKINEANNFT